MSIDGRALAQNILDNLSLRVSILKEKGIIPHLAVVRLGDDPATTSYIRQKEKMAERIGATISVYNFPLDVSEEKLLESIRFLEKDKKTHGIIVQLPLPSHLNQNKLLMEINPDKDIDGFHPKTKFIIPIAAAVMEVLKYVYCHPRPDRGSSLKINQNDSILDSRFRGNDTEGLRNWLKTKTIVVIGKGKAGGKPVVDFLSKNNLKPIVVDSNTENVDKLKKSADIIISAVGKKNIITNQVIKKGVILIGIGMNKDEEGKFYGDYDMEDIKNKAGYYTPVPGGIGPINVAKLMENLVIAAENNIKRD